MSVTGLYVGNGTLRYQSVGNGTQGTQDMARIEVEQTTGDLIEEEQNAANRVTEAADRLAETLIREAEQEMLRENAAVRRNLIAEVMPIPQVDRMPRENFGTIELSPVITFQAAIQRLINETNYYPMVFNMTRSGFMRLKKVLDSGNYEYTNCDIHGEGGLLLIEVTVLGRKELESNYRTEKQLTDLMINEILSTIFHFIGMLHPNADDSKIEAYVEKTMKPFIKVYANNILSILMEKEIEIDGRKRKIVRADNSTSPKPKSRSRTVEELIDEVGDFPDPDRSF